MVVLLSPLLLAYLTVGSSTTSPTMRGLLRQHRRATASALTPPLSGDITALEIEELTAAVKTQFRTAIDDLLLRNGDDTKETALQALSATFGEAAEVSALVTLPSMTHSDLAARIASTKAKDELKLLFDETLGRPDVYKKIENTASDTNHLYKLFATAFTRNGCQLVDEKKREMLLQKRNDIEETCSAFCSAINEHKETVSVTADDMNGVPNLDQFPRNDDDPTVIEIPLKAPFTIPVFSFAKSSKTRQAVAVASARKCQDVNTDRFVETLSLRQECATLLGYDSHAAFMLEPNMAQTPERVETMLWDLVEQLTPHRNADLQVLQALKDQDVNGDGGPLQPWDISYYIRAHKATLGVDEAALQQYFPLEHVKSEILSIYEELLDLKFVQVTDAQVWHEDVQCFAVHAGGDSDHTEPLGFFYFDLYPRDGKYSHQCVYPLRPSYNPSSSTSNGDKSNTERVKPACVNIGNLSRGKDGEPSLLRFREVETFFHEFGHVMHCVLSKSQHSLQAWAWSAVPWPGGVEQDFLEVPSMMLENFVWQKEVLKRLSKKTDAATGDVASLPDDMMESLSRSRTTMEGYSRCRYLAMALYDLKVHSGPGPYKYKDGNEYDAIALYKAMMEDISGVPSIPDTFAAASWFHPMMGYDAGYYSYIYSEVLAADLFSEFEMAGAGGSSVLDTTLGRKYRDTILAPCATVDGDTMLRNFLGREPSNQAFLNRVIGK